MSECEIDATKFKAPTLRMQEWLLCASNRRLGWAGPGTSRLGRARACVVIIHDKKQKTTASGYDELSWVG